MSDATTPRLNRPIDERDHVQGPADAPATLVEYGDYECSHCGATHPVVKEVQRRLGAGLRFAFRNFPLGRIHPHAQAAAEAAEAAAAQGRFWEMHDALFEHQRALEPADLRRYAEELGLDVRRFERDLAEHAFAARVREDFLDGARSGVNGTPTFFVNGRRYNGPADVEGLLAALGGR